MSIVKDFGNISGRRDALDLVSQYITDKRNVNNGKLPFHAVIHGNLLSVYSTDDWTESLRMLPIMLSCLYPDDYQLSQALTHHEYIDRAKQIIDNNISSKNLDKGPLFLPNYKRWTRTPKIIRKSPTHDEVTCIMGTMDALLLDKLTHAEYNRKANIYRIMDDKTSFVFSDEDFRNMLYYLDKCEVATLIGNNFYTNYAQNITFLKYLRYSNLICGSATISGRVLINSRSGRDKRMWNINYTHPSVQLIGDNIRVAPPHNDYNVVYKLVVDNVNDNWLLNIIDGVPQWDPKRPHITERILTPPPKHMLNGSAFSNIVNDPDVKYVTLTRDYYASLWEKRTYKTI